MRAVATIKNRKILYPKAQWGNLLGFLFSKSISGFKPWKPIIAREYSLAIARAPRMRRMDACNCYPLDNNPAVRGTEEGVLCQPPVLISRRVRAVLCDEILLRRLCKSRELYWMGE